MARRAARVDNNMDAIASCFRAAGFSVCSLAMVGGGVPDLLLGFGGTNVLIEVKDSEQPLSKRRFTAAQKKWHAEWKGRAHVVETVEQALLLIHLYRKAIAA